MSAVPAPLVATCLADILDGRHRRLTAQRRLGPAHRVRLEAQVQRLRQLAVDATRHKTGPLKGAVVDAALAGLLVALAGDMLGTVHAIADRLDELGHPGRERFEDLAAWDVAGILEVVVIVPESGA